ncbi:cellulose biosynthesis protein BcsQ [Azospirillum brasilense]|nr:cellulose biosynthesis protein BcsQ [Azospirillum brasilense]
MARVHMTLQGKGGVGKSFIAAMIAQYLKGKGGNPICVDTDPVNATFHGYKSLGVRRLDIMHQDEIDTRRFDELVEIIAGASEDVVIDNGANAFVPLSNYLLSNGVPAMLHDMQRELVVHSVVTGGQAMIDTLSNFGLIVKQFEAATIVVWENPFWGTVEMDGKSFEQMKVFTGNRDRISAVIRVPVLKGETFGRDLSELLQRRQTFDEALAPDSGLPIMVRQRLKQIQRDLFAQMEAARVL